MTNARAVFREEMNPGGNPWIYRSSVIDSHTYIKVPSTEMRAINKSTLFYPNSEKCEGVYIISSWISQIKISIYINCRVTTPYWMISDYTKKNPLPRSENMLPSFSLVNFAISQIKIYEEYKESRRYMCVPRVSLGITFRKLRNLRKIKLLIRAKQ